MKVIDILDLITNDNINVYVKDFADDTILSFYDGKNSIDLEHNSKEVESIGTDENGNFIIYVY